jgi:hypothetical protein
MDSRYDPCEIMIFTPFCYSHATGLLGVGYIYLYYTIYLHLYTAYDYFLYSRNILVSFTICHYSKARVGVIILILPCIILQDQILLVIVWYPKQATEVDDVGCLIQTWSLY